MKKSIWGILSTFIVCSSLGLLFPDILQAGEKKLTLPGTNYYNIDNNSEYDDNFGAAVAISGDYAIVSAPNWDSDVIANDGDVDDMNWGSGWIFKRDQGGAGNWGLLTQLTDSNPRYDPYGRNDHLGVTVAIDGDTAVMCSGETALTQNWSAEFGACAIYYQNNGGTDHWGVEKWVQGHTNTESQHYGYASAMSGDYLVVGERNYGGDWNGAAFIYQRDYGGADNWGTVKTMSGFPSSAAFGVSVDVDGTASPVRVIIGADYNPDGQAGAAYIYEKGGTATTWTVPTSGTKTGDVSGDQFGHAVGIYGNWAFVGAPKNAGGGTQRGKVYVYLRDGTGSWNLSTSLTAGDAANYDNFGSTISVHNDTLLIGASGDDPAGSVYVYKLNGTTWTYQKKLTGSGTEAGDGFGYYSSSVTTISVSGATAIVGAPDYDTTHDNEGAAFVFDLQGGGAAAPLNLLLLD